MSEYCVNRTQILPFWSVLLALIASSCLGFILVELIHVMKYVQKREERLWIGIAVASLVISAFAFVSFIDLSCTVMFYTSDTRIKVAPTPNPEAAHQPSMV